MPKALSTLIKRGAANGEEFARSACSFVKQNSTLPQLCNPIRRTSVKTTATRRHSLQAVGNKNYFTHFAAISCNSSAARLREILEISLTLIGCHSLAAKCIRLQPITSGSNWEWQKSWRA
jgi:hypothetical protein